ncbi:uncharacterized protein LOC112497538 isoform X1 [Citrus sinensis]|uniref:uncharacterized protein LOC112497538 isoform X1 n=1 Tax=Citrus sinensis TaxID=2711 RepID=UPI002279B963|nr:uncharacterized protein LOC112497538 isoform X1 [Citrus sinensis]
MGSNSELHVVLTTMLSLDRKTMYMKLILLDYFPVLLLFCWWFVMYGVDAPLITLTAETCSMALILTVLFEVRWRCLFKYFKKEKDLKNIIQFTETLQYCQIMYDHHQAPPKSFMLSSIVFLNFAGVLNAAVLYIAPLGLFLEPDGDVFFYLMGFVLFGFSCLQISFIQPLLLNCDADTFKFIRSQALVFSETTTAAATTAKEPPESSGSVEIV